MGRSDLSFCRSADKLGAAAVLLFKIAGATPSRVVGTTVASSDPSDATPSRPKGTPSRLGLAAVPLPIPVGASQATPVLTSMVPVVNSIGPDMGGNVGGWVLGWWAAAGGAMAGGAGMQRRKNNGRRRRGDRVAGQAVAVAVEDTDLESEFDIEEQEEGGQVIFMPQGGVEQVQQFGQMQQGGFAGHPQLQQVPVNMVGSNGQWQPQQFQMVQAQQMPFGAFGQAENGQPVMQAVGVMVPVDMPYAMPMQQGGYGQCLPQQPQMMQQMVPLQPAMQMVPVSQGTSSSASSSGYQLPLPRRLWQAPSQADTTSDAGSVSVKSSHAGERSKWPSPEANRAMAELRAGDSDGRRALLERITSPGETWAMAMTKHGCRVLQVALEVASPAQRIIMASALQHHVMEAMRSPHGNHVLQQIVTVMPPDNVKFVIEEMRGKVREVSRHAFGCRVLERLFEHCPVEMTAELFREVIDEALELCKHQYGNYVIQHAFTHGTLQIRHRLLEAMLPEVGKIARHKNGSHAIEHAVIYCGDEDFARLMDILASSPEELASLTSSNYGSFVAKELNKRDEKLKKRCAQ